MTLNSLPAIVTLLIALSVATERFVEIVKGFVPWLDEASLNRRREAHRRAWLQILAATGGVGITVVTWPVVSEVIGEAGTGPATPSINWPTVLALGFLASGGSGFWNSILTYVTSMKELKRVDVRDREAASAARPLPDPAAGTLSS